MPVNGTNGSLSSRGFGGFGASNAVGFQFYEEIDGDYNNYNLRTNALAAGWNGTDPISATVLVAAGIKVCSTSQATAAFDTGMIPANSQVVLINNGQILGFGGEGGNASAGAGGNGGIAIQLRTIPLMIIANNANAIIGGGGGGGGAGATLTIAANTIGGSGGGGGAGCFVGTSGTGAAGTLANGNPGQPGTFTLGGLGGAAATFGAIMSIFGQVFTTSGSFTVPAGVTSLRVTGAGGGAGGGGGADPYQGGNGGSGGVGLGWLTVTPGQTISVTIGDAGSGGFAGGTDNATDGTDTIFSTMTFGRGFRGRAGSHVSPGNSGANGSVTGATQLIYGYFAVRGNGGGGGAGGSPNYNGANGTAGIVVIEW